MNRISRGDASYAAALAEREFRVIFAAFGVAITGSVVSAVALTVEVFDRTRSPLLSALTFALGFVPYVFGGTLLSGLVDRVPPRRLLVSCDLCAAGLLAAMALPGLPVAALLALLVGIGTLTSVSSGAQGALVRSVVPAASYVPARSLLRVCAQVAQVAGNAAGGAVLVVLTPAGAFLASGAALAGAALVMRLGLAPHPVPGVAEPTALVRDSLRGLRQVLGHARLRRLLLLGWLVPMFSVAPEALAAPYVAGHGGSQVLVGWWLAALPVGMVAGDLLGVLGLSPGRQRSLVGLAAGAFFVPYLVFLAGPPIVVALPLLAGAGLCGVYSLGLDALVRQAAPEQLFARTMAVSSAGLLTLQGLGFGLAGLAAQFVGPGWAITGAGACGLVTVAWLRPRAADAAGPAARLEGKGARQGRGMADQC
jgi:Major Facilitator Superfamily